MHKDFRNLILSIEYVGIDTIKPFDRNPRTHTKAQIQQIGNSILKFGWVNPILIDENNEIIAGHGRLLAGKEIGYDKVPVAQIKHLSKAEKLALLIADNKISDNAGWDEDKLQSALHELYEDKFDLSALGFSNKEIEEFKDEFENTEESIEQDNDVPELPAASVSQQGDIWILGEHAVLCGDSCIKENLELLMGEERAAMTFTDPPYNVAYDGSFRDKSENKTERTILNDNLGNDFYDFLFPAMENILEYTKGSTYICMGGSELHTLHKAFKDAGGKWETYIVWVKNHISLSRARYQHQHEWIMFGNQHEEIMLGHKKGGDVQWYGGRNQSDVWNFDRPLKNDLHPTMKPVALIERAINNSSKVMDIVLDAFGGSGSTLIAAEKTQRRCRMIELDEKYVDVIVRRWEDFTGQTAVHKISGKTFAETAQERKI
jgi:DNA modification methylase